MGDEGIEQKIKSKNEKGKERERRGNLEVGEKLKEKLKLKCLTVNFLGSLSSYMFH